MKYEQRVMPSTFTQPFHPKLYGSEPAPPKSGRIWLGESSYSSRSPRSQHTPPAETGGGTGAGAAAAVDEADGEDRLVAPSTGLLVCAAAAWAIAVGLVLAVASDNAPSGNGLSTL